MKITVSCSPTIFDMDTVGDENEYKHTGCKLLMEDIQHDSEAIIVLDHR